MKKKHIPRIIIVLGLIIHSIASYLLPWIGYPRLINLNIVSVIGITTTLIGVALLFYYN